MGYTVEEKFEDVVDYDFVVAQMENIFIEAFGRNVFTYKG
jgi:hypothetical protein